MLHPGGKENPKGSSAQWSFPELAIYISATPQPFMPFTNIAKNWTLFP
jgi:hypothetical protein